MYLDRLYRQLEQHTTEAIDKLAHKISNLESTDANIKTAVENKFLEMEDVDARMKGSLNKMFGVTALYQKLSAMISKDFSKQQGSARKWGNRIREQLTGL